MYEFPEHIGKHIHGTKMFVFNSEYELTVKEFIVTEIILRDIENSKSYHSMNIPGFLHLLKYHQNKNIELYNYIFNENVEYLI